MKYEIKRGNETILNHEIEGVRTKSAPAEDFIDIDFDYPHAILFKKNDTIVFKGQTYYCDSQYNYTIKSGKNTYNHKSRFVSENYRATEIAFLNYEGLSSFPIESNLTTLLNLAVHNLNRVSSGWSVSSDIPETNVEKFEIEAENVMSFLVKLSGTFDIPFRIVDKKITFGAEPARPTNTTAYGKGNGLLDIKVFYNNNVKAPNVVYANGGNGLFIPPIQNNTDIAKNGIVEGFYTNPEIYPTTESNVRVTSTTPRIIHSNLDYNINDNKIGNQLPIVNFTSGNLAGISFYVDFVDTDFDFKTFHVVPRDIDGETLPNSVKKAVKGDIFNITNIRQPYQIEGLAKTKLRAEANAFMNNGLKKGLKIEVSLDPLVKNEINLNSLVYIKDVDLNLDDTWRVTTIREDLQNLNKKDVTLEYERKYFLRYSLKHYVKDFESLETDFVNKKVLVVSDNLVAVEVKADSAVSGVENINNNIVPTLATKNNLNLVSDDVVLIKANTSGITNNSSGTDIVFSKPINVTNKIITQEGEGISHPKLTLKGLDHLVFENGILVSFS